MPNYISNSPACELEIREVVTQLHTEGKALDTAVLELDTLAKSHGVDPGDVLLHARDVFNILNEDSATRDYVLTPPVAETTLDADRPDFDYFDMAAEAATSEESEAKLHFQKQSAIAFTKLFDAAKKSSLTRIKDHLYAQLGSETEPGPLTISIARYREQAMANKWNAPSKKAWQDELEKKALCLLQIFAAELLIPHIKDVRVYALPDQLGQLVFKSKDKEQYKKLLSFWGGVVRNTRVIKTK